MGCGCKKKSGQFQQQLAQKLASPQIVQTSKLPPVVSPIALSPRALRIQARAERIARRARRMYIRQRRAERFARLNSNPTPSTLSDNTSSQK